VGPRTREYLKRLQHWSLKPVTSVAGTFWPGRRPAERYGSMPAGKRCLGRRSSERGTTRSINHGWSARQLSRLLDGREERTRTWMWAEVAVESRTPLSQSAKSRGGGEDDEVDGEVEVKDDGEEEGDVIILVSSWPCVSFCRLATRSSLPAMVAHSRRTFFSSTSSASESVVPSGGADPPLPSTPCLLKSWWPSSTSSWMLLWLVGTGAGCGNGPMAAVVVVVSEAGSG
jgi:hypothetical protein